MNLQLSSIPALNIEFNNVLLTSKNLRTLWEVRVQEKLLSPALCELTFLEPTESFLENETATPGTALRVFLPGGEEPLFAGEVTAVTHFYEPSRGRGVRVRGYDALHRLRKRQPVRAHVQVTIADLCRELTADLGLEIEAHQDSPIWQRIIQFEQTDFELLSEFAASCGLYFALRQNQLHLFTLAGIGDAVALSLGNNLLSANVEINAENVCDSILAKGWDVQRVETFEARANAARSGRQINFALAPNVFGTSAENTIVDQNLTDELHAAAVAQSLLDRRKSRQIVFSGIAEGNPSLRVGTIVELENIAAQIAGRYVLAQVNHVFDSQQGFVSEISTQLPKIKINNQNASSIATLGVIIDINDPERFGRVRVRLPNYNNVETDWLGVVAAGAGLGKGLLTLPDVEDTVLVLFPKGNPAQGIVLGGLYGSLMREDWDWGVEDGAVKRFSLQTPNGQIVRLDDAHKIVRIENSDGSFIEMSPEKVRIHANRDLEIEAPGRALTIKAKTIDFEQINAATQNTDSQ